MHNIPGAHIPATSNFLLGRVNAQQCRCAGEVVGVNRRVPCCRRSFDTKAGEWQTVRLPFSEFVPVFRARTQRDAGCIDASVVHSVQLMLSKFEYDGELNPAFRPGPFSLPVCRPGRRH